MKLHVIRQKTLPPFNGQKVLAIHQRLIILIADEKWASYSKDPFSLKVGQCWKVQPRPAYQTHVNYNIVSKDEVLRLAGNGCWGKQDYSTKKMSESKLAGKWAWGTWGGGHSKHWLMTYTIQEFSNFKYKRITYRPDRMQIPEPHLLRGSFNRWGRPRISVRVPVW